MSSIATSLFDLIGRYIDASGEEDREKLRSALQKELETTLMAERLKFESFRELHAERALLYKEVWKRIDLVSFDRWTREKGVPRSIDKERVLFLRHYVVDLNEEKGYVFDPASRAFLLDLRWWCRKCADAASENNIEWIYKDQERNAEYPHGIKLWMLKSGLRRSMVRALHRPEAGDPSYFDRSAMEKIVEGIRETIIDDLKRFSGDAYGKEVIDGIVTALFPKRSAYTSGGGG